MLINKVYKFRVYPTKMQEEKFANYFGCTRFVYNYFLTERKVQYEKNGRSDNYYTQQKKLTQLRYNDNYNWLNNVALISLQGALRNLEKAYTNFFAKRSAFPKYHKKSSRQSFISTQKIYVDESNRLHIVGYKEGLKLKYSREVLGKIKEATIVKYPSGKYYANIVTEQEIEVKDKKQNRIGIDLGIKDLIITSDGIKYQNPKFINKYQKQLADAQRHLSRKLKGSRGFENQRIKVARIQEKIANCRNDNLHKISYRLTRDYSDIFLEDLNVQAMQKNKHLSKLISDCAWNKLYNMLEYKGQWNNCRVHKINRYYASSKTCFNCNYTLESLNLNERSWTCPVCGKKHDRDINAAINILNEGLRELSAGTVDYTDGETVRIRNRKKSNQVLMKSESYDFSHK